MLDLFVVDVREEVAHQSLPRHTSEFIVANELHEFDNGILIDGCVRRVVEIVELLQCEPLAECCYVFHVRYTASSVSPTMASGKPKRKQLY